MMELKGGPIQWVVPSWTRAGSSGRFLRLLRRDSKEAEPLASPPLLPLGWGQAVSISSALPPQPVTGSPRNTSPQRGRGEGLMDLSPQCYPAQPSPSLSNLLSPGTPSFSLPSSQLGAGRAGHAGLSGWPCFPQQMTLGQAGPAWPEFKQPCPAALDSNPRE